MKNNNNAFLMSLKKDFIVLVGVLVVFVAVQLYNGSWSLPELLLTDAIFVAFWVAATYIETYIRPKNDGETEEKTLKKYFKFTKFRESIKAFILFFTAWISFEIHESPIFTADKIVIYLGTAILCIAITLVIDWVQLHNANAIR